MEISFYKKGTLHESRSITSLSKYIRRKQRRQIFIGKDKDKRTLESYCHEFIAEMQLKWRHDLQQGGKWRHDLLQDGNWRHDLQQGGNWRHDLQQGGNGGMTYSRAGIGGMTNSRAGNGGMTYSRAGNGGMTYSRAGNGGMTYSRAGIQLLKQFQINNYRCILFTHLNCNIKIILLSS